MQDAGNGAPGASENAGPEEDLVGPVIVPLSRPTYPYDDVVAADAADDPVRTDIEVGDSGLFGVDDSETVDLSYTSESPIQIMRPVVPPYVVPDDSEGVRVIPLEAPFNFLIDRDYWGPQSLSLVDETSGANLISKAKRLGCLNTKAINSLDSFCSNFKRGEGLRGLLGEMVGQNGVRLSAPMFDVAQMYHHILTVDTNVLPPENGARHLLLLLLYDVFSQLGIAYTGRDFRAAVNRSRMEASRSLIIQEIEFQIIRDLAVKYIDDRYAEMKEAAGIRYARVDLNLLVRKVIQIVDILKLSVVRTVGIGADLYDHLLLGLKVYFLQPEGNPAALASVRDIMERWSHNLTLSKRALATHTTPVPTDGVAEILHLIGRANQHLTDAIAAGHRLEETTADNLAGFVSHEIIRDPATQFPILGRVDARISTDHVDSALHYEYETRRFKEVDGKHADSDRAKEANYGTLSVSYVPIPNASSYLARHIRPDVVLNREFVWNEMRDLITDAALRDRKRFTMSDWSPSYMVNIPAAVLLEAAALTHADRVKLLSIDGRETVSLLYETSSPGVVPPQWDAIIGGQYHVSDPLTLLMLANRPMTSSPLPISNLDLRPATDAQWMGVGIKGEHTTQPLISYTNTYDTQALYNNKIYRLRFKHDLLNLLGNYITGEGADEQEDVRSRIISPTRPDLVWAYNSMYFLLESLDRLEKIWSEGGTLTEGYVLSKARHRAQRFFAEVVVPALTISEAEDIFQSVVTRGPGSGTSVTAMDKSGAPLYRTSTALGYSPFGYLRNLLITNADNFKEVIGLMALIAATFGASGLSFLGTETNEKKMAKGLSHYLELMMRERVDLYHIPDRGRVNLD